MIMIIALVIAKTVELLVHSGVPWAAAVGTETPTAIPVKPLTTIIEIKMTALSLSTDS